MNVTIKGSKITIVLDLNVKGTPSASGKSLVYATTRGNIDAGVALGGKDLTIGVNVFAKV